MKIWLDNNIEAPEGYIHCHSEEMAIAWIKAGDEHFDRCAYLANEDVKNGCDKTKSAFHSHGERFNTSIVSISSDINSDKILEYIKERGRECVIERHHFPG